MDSTPGEGTAFTITLPARVRKPSADSKKENPLLIGNEEILIVDDEPEVLEIHGRLLEHFGYRVKPLNSPSAALEFFRDQPKEMDLVLIDQKIPGMTGDELGARIGFLCPDLPLILCAGDPGEKADYSGFHAVLPKPVTARRLAQTVRKVIDQSQGELSGDCNSIRKNS